MLSFPKAWGPARLALQDATDGGTLWAGRSQARRGLVLVGSLAPAAGSLSSGRSLQLRSSPKLPRGGWPAFLTAPRPPQHSWAAGAPLPWFSRSPRAAPPQVLPVGLVSRGVTSTTSLHASAGGGKSASAKSEKQKKKLKDKEMAEKEKAIEAEIKDAKWSGRLEELRLVAAGNGGTAHVSQGDPERPALGTWCNTQRGKERRGKLGAGRKARLLEIGFVFEILEDAWDKSLEELRVVAAGTGGIAHVSRLDTDRPELGTWCLKQRNIEECGEIREDRKDRLLEIGFVFGGVGGGGRTPRGPEGSSPRDRVRLPRVVGEAAPADYRGTSLI
ncbi:hypothetical protein T484DRAFT_1951024, partial [Baffinella frigidus]